MNSVALPSQNTANGTHTSGALRLAEIVDSSAQLIYLTHG
jgi:hypothetical protein